MNTKVLGLALAAALAATTAAKAEIVTVLFDFTVTEVDTSGIPVPDVTFASPPEVGDALSGSLTADLSTPISEGLFFTGSVEIDGAPDTFFDDGTIDPFLELINAGRFTQDFSQGVQTDTGFFIDGWTYVDPDPNVLTLLDIIGYLDTAEEAQIRLTHQFIAARTAGLIAARTTADFNSEQAYIGTISNVRVPPPVVPLPASALLLIGGLGALGLAGRRRRAKADA